MEWLLLATALLFVAVLAALLPAFREEYEERYEDEEAFLRNRHPNAWGLVAGGTTDESDRGSNGVRCPACDTENGPDFEYCRRCNRRLPAREG